MWLICLGHLYKHPRGTVAHSDFIPDRTSSQKTPKASFSSLEKKNCKSRTFEKTQNSHPVREGTDFRAGNPRIPPSGSSLDGTRHVFDLPSPSQFPMDGRDRREYSDFYFNHAPTFTSDRSLFASRAVEEKNSPLWFPETPPPPPPLSLVFLSWNRRVSRSTRRERDEGLSWARARPSTEFKSREPTASTLASRGSPVPR